MIRFIKDFWILIIPVFFLVFIVYSIFKVESEEVVYKTPDWYDKLMWDAEHRKFQKRIEDIEIRNYLLKQARIKTEGE